jgi:hypothetical protein
MRLVAPRDVSVEFESLEVRALRRDERENRFNNVASVA